MELPTSQASSHFPIEPVSAAVLVDAEVRRRDALRALGCCKTGCADVDDYVLLGGFERGCVVGVTAEDEELGVLVSEKIDGSMVPGHTISSRIRTGRGLTVDCSCYSSACSSSCTLSAALLQRRRRP